mmetsp:Transcript_51827/g.60558  ORF Transcript_51827/g.60558 Transcript_51827/m.60558 type:complete len:174 (+) Transcript_51827:27-548(+)
MLYKTSLVILISTFVAIFLFASHSTAFNPQSLVSRKHLLGNSCGGTSTTVVRFKIPFTDSQKDEEEPPKGKRKGKGKGKAKEEESDYIEPKIGLKGLFQLITAGAGSPFLGDFEGIDKKTGNFMFSLEANNLVDEKGNSKQTQAAYFENGWVDDDSEKESEKKKKKGSGWKLW